MQDAQIPRQLSDAERSLLRWLLPENRPGYDACFRSILSKRILGVGRWGAGDMIFGEEGGRIDLSGPMAHSIFTLSGPWNEQLEKSGSG